MKILSPFKDYYDYISHLFGIDNSIIYKRNTFKIKKKLKNETIFESLLFTTKTLSNHYSIYPRFPVLKVEIYKFKWLIVCGKQFLLVSEKQKDNTYSDYKLITINQYNDIKAYWNSYRKIKDYDYFVGSISNPIYIEISKLINNPIFEMSDTINLFGDDISTNDTYFEFKSLSIGKYGIANFYTPERLYQDLSYFIGNTLKDTPDIKPPVEVSNKDKIIGHGFDYVSSFRGKK